MLLERAVKFADQLRNARGRALHVLVDDLREALVTFSRRRIEAADESLMRGIERRRRLRAQLAFHAEQGSGQALFHFRRSRTQRCFLIGSEALQARLMLLAIHAQQLETIAQSGSARLD